MGGAVSSGESNDDLIDNLLEADYIKSPLIERIFRAVDRAFYYTEPYKQNAYKDLAWKDGNLHLSAPCIYSEVLENLELEPGLSFLNIGSGTGYFSTMCGLILGRNGINHGIELYPDVVNYARMKLDEFERTSPALDEFSFCPPEFTVGNFLDAIAVSKRYDRIYCGAACPNDYVGNLIDMLKIGGICVVPVGDSLVQITRVEDKKDERKVLLPVTFATLIAPKDNTPRAPVELPEWSPKTLTELCRLEIRATLRQTIIYPEPKSVAEENRKKKRKRRQERRRASRLVVVQRRRSGLGGEPDGGGDNGFVAIAYSMGSNSSGSDEDRNLQIDATQNFDDNGGASSEGSQEEGSNHSRNDLGDDDTIMEEEGETPKTDTTSSEKTTTNTNNDVTSNSTSTSSDAPKNGGVAVVTGSCPIYATAEAGNDNSSPKDTTIDQRSNGSATTSRGSNSSRSTGSSRSSRSGRSYTTGAESLLGRIRELVRARQQDLESMRRQFHRNADSDSGRSRSEIVGADDEASGGENGHADLLYSDISSSESSPSALSATSSTSDDEGPGEGQSDSCKRCRNESDSTDDLNKKEACTVASKLDPLLMNSCSVQMRKKILDLPLPPALKVYLNYERKLYY